MSEIATLRSQDELLSALRGLMRDTAAARWTDAEMYAALNRALSTWGNRVRVPWLYEMPSGWDSSTYAYALPAYMDEYIRPQVKANALAWWDHYAGDTTVYTWVDIHGWEVEPDGSGGLTLRMHTQPVTEDGRIVWYMPVGQVPATVPTLTSELASDATSAALTVTEVWPVARAGWVKIDDEWMQYAGVTRTSSTSITLTGLERAVYATTAATHSAGASVYWGVAADRDDLWNVLFMQATSYLHQMFMTDGSNTENDTHATMIQLNNSEVKEFWRGYLPSWRPRSVLTRGAKGPRLY